MKYIDFKIGADPEFGAFVNNTFVAAHSIIVNRNESDFGLDGCSSIFEIRPKASICPFVVVNNIQKIFNKHLTNEQYKHCEFRAGSLVGKYSIGGHIHLEIPPSVQTQSGSILDYNDFLNKFCETHHTILSQYISIPLSLLESSNNRIKRINNGYGRLYDYRVQPYGIEVRAASSWLSSPHAAASALCLAKMVHFELLNNPKFKEHIIKDKSIVTTFKQKDIKPLVVIFNEKIWPVLQKMTLYPIYKKQINLIKYLVDNNLTWHTKRDLRTSWGIKPAEILEIPKITFETIWAN